jgi:chaperone required for assembly of F1-ATPase
LIDCEIEYNLNDSLPISSLFEKCIELMQILITNNGISQSLRQYLQSMLFCLQDIHNHFNAYLKNLQLIYYIQYIQDLLKERKANSTKEFQKLIKSILESRSIDESIINIGKLHFRAIKRNKKDLDEIIYWFCDAHCVKPDEEEQNDDIVAVKDINLLVKTAQSYQYNNDEDTNKCLKYQTFPSMDSLKSIETFNI